MARITVAQAAKKFLAAAAADVAPSTLALYRLYVNRFVQRHGRRQVDRLSPAIVRAWGITYHPVQAVQRLCSWCHREARLIRTNPLEGMRKMPRGRRLRTMTRAEAARLIRAARGATRRFLIALRETMARPGELRTVTWDQVRTVGLRPFEVHDLTAGNAFFYFDEFKGKARRSEPNSLRVIPVSKRLGRLMARLQEIGPDVGEQVFLNRRGKPWTVNAVRCAFRQLKHATGADLDRRGEGIVAYTFRHTGATNAVVAGVPIAELAAAMGHVDIRQTHKYIHLAPTFLKSVMDKIDRAKHEGKAKNGRPRLRRIDPDDLG